MQAQPFWPLEGFLGFGTRGMSHTPVLHVFFLGGVAGTPMELMLLNQVPVALWGIVLAGSLLQPVTLRMLLSHGIMWGPEKGRDRPLSFRGVHCQPFPAWPCTLLPSSHPHPHPQHLAGIPVQAPCSESTHSPPFSPVSLLLLVGEGGVPRVLPRCTRGSVRDCFWNQPAKHLAPITCYQRE